MATSVPFAGDSLRRSCDRRGDSLMKYGMPGLQSQCMSLFFSLLLAAACGFPQTSQELRQRYGPANSEHYTVRPGIILVATYTDNGEPCEMRIEPKKAPGVSSSDTMDSEVVTEIIDELVPVDRRGTFVAGYDVNGGCTGYKSAEYELVRISLTTRCQAQGGGTYSASILWKAANCEHNSGMKSRRSIHLNWWPLGSTPVLQVKPYRDSRF